MRRLVEPARRDRAHRRRHHVLRRRSSGHDALGALGTAHPEARARARASAPVLHRPGRGRHDLLDAIADEQRLMPHLHLSLQAGDDMILEADEAPPSPGRCRRFCEQVRRLRPDVVFGADLIAGFPTETEAMFANSLELVDDVQPHLPACVPVLAAPGHAGGAHAADRPPRGEGARCAPAHERRRESSPVIWSARRAASWTCSPSAMAWGARRTLPRLRSRRRSRRACWPERGSRATTAPGFMVRYWLERKC